MLKSVHVHFLNKFPSAKVVRGDNYVAVYAPSGSLIMRAGINAHGVMVDQQLEHGAMLPLCISPIPKDARRIKLFKDGTIRQAEEFDARNDYARALEAKHGYVPSEVQLKHQPRETKQISQVREVPQVISVPMPQADGSSKMVDQSVVAKVTEMVPVVSIGELPSQEAAMAKEKGIG
jgi:hypothetical protein